MSEQFPLSIREVAPGPGFTRMAMTPGEGLHTGGPFFSEERQEVWKPLDGRPDGGADCHLRTQEETVLRLMTGTVGFPANWRVEEANGRRWLVRKKVWPVPEEYRPEWVTRAMALQVEQAVRALNAKAWEVNDFLRVAVDPDTEEPFLLDLSAARRVGGKSAPFAFRANDAWRFSYWATHVVGVQLLVRLRQQAKYVVSTADWRRRPYGMTHTWVYGSRTRPMDASWASIPDAVYIPADKASTDMWTWVAVPRPLEGDVVQRYGLEWGYGPILYDADAP